MPLARDLHAKTREALQKINKILQSIQCELANNASELTKINECIRKDSKKLKEVKGDPTYSEEQKAAIYG